MRDWNSKLSKFGVWLQYERLKDGSYLDNFESSDDTETIDDSGSSSESEIKVPNSMGNTIINFGKHKGRTFEYVGVNDTKYSNWIINLKGIQVDQVYDLKIYLRKELNYYTGHR